MKRVLTILIVSLSSLFALNLSDMMQSAMNNFTNATKQTHYVAGEIDFRKINPSDVTNIYGNLQITGNTVMCVTNKQSATLSDYEKKYSDFSCTTDIYKNDNNYITRYINIDPDNPDIWNSSEATIKLPGTYKKIVWAGLFWQGYLNNYSKIYQEGKTWRWSNDLPDNDITKTTANRVLMKINGHSYIPIVADELEYYMKDSRYRSGYKGDVYSAWADITDLLNQYQYQPGEDINITVANIATSMGLEKDHGDYGGWSIVVIYKEDINNPLSKLRNNSVYYGFKFVSRDHSVNIEINNLVLPNKVGQPINTYMALFSAEGEYRYSPDYVELNNQKLTENLIYDGKDVFNPNNVFDARLSDDIQRNPKLYNNDGLDIDVFNNASEILTQMRDAHPNQKSYSAEISLITENERFTPSVVVFSTELYKPRVCYYIDSIKDDSGNYVYKDGKFVTNKIDATKEYTIKFWISNMKQNENDEDIDTAKNVKVYMDLSDFNYAANTTEIQNLGQDRLYPQTDVKDSDLFYFDSNNNKGEYHLGIGANGSEGGTIGVAANFNDDTKKAFVTFKGKFDVNGNEENQTVNLNDIMTFKASFSTDFVTIDENNALEIAKCVPFDTQVNVYIPQAGTFNVVEPTFNSNQDPISADDSLNQLYTKIADKPFDVKVLHLASNKTTLSKYKGPVEVDLINAPHNEEECSANESLFKRFLYFANKKTEEISGINISKAYRDVRFRVRYPNYNMPKSCRNLIRKFPHQCQFNGNTVENANLNPNQQKKMMNTATQCMIDLIRLAPPPEKVLSCMFECGGIEFDKMGRDFGNIVSGNGNTNRYRFRHRCHEGAQCVLECLFADTKAVCSRDDFSIRPYQYKIIQNINGSMKAGRNYPYVIEALSFTNRVVPNYDAVIGDSVNFEYKDTNESKGCHHGELFYSQTPFNNGAANVNMAYNEVGDLNITVKEVPGKEFAKVDEGESGSDVYIKPASKVFKYIPDYFEVKSVSFVNKGSGFTYLIGDKNTVSSMGGILNLEIEAKNAQGRPTLLYNKNCYAKNVNVKFLHNTPQNTLPVVYQSGNEGVKEINNTEPIVFSVSKESFENGDSNSTTFINLKKSYSKPVEPFDFELTKIYLKDPDNVSKEQTLNNMEIHFIYGRANVQNIAGYSQVLHGSVKYEYFENGKWKVNTNHTTPDLGAVNSVYAPKVSSEIAGVDHGYQDIKYSSSIAPYSVKAHYDIASWLWYHPKATIYQAPSLSNLNCLTHPCAKIEFLKVGNGWAGVGDNNSRYAPDKNKTVKFNSSADMNASKSQVKKLNW